MKVLLLTRSPMRLFRGCGNTVRRFREGLQRRGHLCELLGSEDDGGIKESLEGTIGRFKPDIVHAHDASMGVALLGLRTPWVVSLTGEDLHVRMLDDREGPLLCEVARHAHRVLVPDAEAARALEERVPDAVGAIDVVPRAALRLDTKGTDLRRSLGISRQRFLVLLPGGLRPVKGQHRALSLIPVLRGHGVDAEMIVVGPEQDEEYAKEVRERAAQVQGMRVLPALSPERMGAAYQDADVVLNTSLFEGCSPVILEAGVLGRTVVASNVPGNAQLIRHKETGLLYQDEEEMARMVLALARNRSACGAMGLRMREDFAKRFSDEREIDLLLSAYAAA
ncbi:MAG: glycosyltransferase family 4 protein [Planctomycetes bacterium]|nr:glycosyltransferase family 4 protein [Planctomycetota bacterium]